ncbi:MAG: competence/damage-inducible protein A [Saprospiraceae bacterium]|nr:competence/damage-inducible protein A [Saprospiraceae bacterium]
MNAFLLTVGDEILLGQTLDTNSAWLGRELNLLGIRVIRRLTVGDDHNEILASLEEGFRTAGLVIMTGGLGPTKDDITKKAIAAFYGTELVFSEETWQRIQRIFTRLGRTVTEGHRQQCWMPANARLLPNRMGTAPGMWFDDRGRILLSLPGVPYEMQAIMEDAALPELRQLPGVTPIIHQTLLTAGLGESEIAQRLEAFEDALPAHIRLAYLPSPGLVRLRLSAYDGQQDIRKAEVDQQAEAIRALLGHAVFGEGEDTLEAAVGRLLSGQGRTVATAESCTGGYIAHRITGVAGASQWYLGSIIPYHNYLKTSQLGVPAETLFAHGAVSEPVVLDMLHGVLQRLGADVGIAASGVAGPGGGTETKPVGLVWIAVGDMHHPRAIRLQLGKDRQKNIEMTAIHALQHLRLWLLEHRPETSG